LEQGYRHRVVVPTAVLHPLGAPYTFFARTLRAHRESRKRIVGRRLPQRPHPNKVCNLKPRLRSSRSIAMRQMKFPRRVVSLTYQLDTCRMRDRPQRPVAATSSSGGINKRTSGRVGEKTSWTRSVAASAPPAGTQRCGSAHRQAPYAEMAKSKLASGIDRLGVAVNYRESRPSFECRSPAVASCA